MGRFERWAPLASARAVAVVWGPIALITAAHYLAGEHLHYLHDIFRRLYYLPIILGAFQFGLPGALAASAVVLVAYFPHAFTSMATMDPAHGSEKILEMVLYAVVGVITGTLVERERRQRRRAERAAAELATALEDKRVMEQEVIRAGRLSALGELTAGLAHEIKNPLASLKGTAEIFGDDIPLTSPRRRFLDLHLKEIDRLTALLDRFLSFARPQGLEVGDVDLEAVVDDVLSLAAAVARQAGVRLERAPAVPGPGVKGDRKLIAQVALNLVLNALQAVAGKGDPDGRVILSVAGETRSRRAFRCLEVADTGPGVPPDLRDRIFNPFFTTRPEGAGLGLSISARIVEEHGGLLEVTDRDGGGARFRVLLPEAST